MGHILNTFLDKPARTQVCLNAVAIGSGAIDLWRQEYTKKLQNTTRNKLQADLLDIIHFSQ